MTFPATLDSLKSTWIPGETRSSHSSTHNSIASLLLAIQTKIGITGSAVTTSIQYFMNTQATTNTNQATTNTNLSTLAGNALPKAGGVMTGKVTIKSSDTIAATYTPALGAQTVLLNCVDNVHVITGHASGTNITFTISNSTNDQIIIVSILQGAALSTITAWFATIRWAGNVVPTLTPIVGKRDTFAFKRTGTNTYDGFIIGQNC